MTNNADQKKGLGRFFKSPDSIFELIVTGGFLALSLGVLLYYITGPALGYFHSDCADSLIWAQVMIESGDILSESFSYAAILPFGAPLWMLPILKIFGFTMKAQTISMCVFTVIFVLSALSMFRAMKWKYSLCSVATFCLSMILSSSVKLREIMWEHVIYYSLGILFLIIMLNLMFRLCDKLSAFPDGQRSDKIKAIVYAALLFVMCAGAATDGFQVIALTSVPVIAALIAYTIFNEGEKLNSDNAIKRYLICAVIGVGTVAGMILLSVITKGGQISAGYGDAYSTWSPIGEWKANAELFIPQIFTLVGVNVYPAEALFSGKSILMFLRLIGTLILLICPFVLLFRSISQKSSLDKYSRMVAWAHLVVAAAVMVGFICGRLSNANWRLTPLLGSAVMATLVLIKNTLSDRIVVRRVGVVLAAVLLCFSLLSATEILKMDRDFGKVDPLQSVADTLEEKGYDRGYATFWNAAETTLRSDSAVTVITVTADHSGVNKRPYQTMDYWFDDVAGQEEYFLILDQAEYNSVYGGAYWRNLTSRVQVIDEFACEGYHIVVFDGNIFSNK